jgi:hypothetical protein
MSETSFEELGYLSSAVAKESEAIRAENKDWFQLADDLNALLMCIAKHATSTVKTDKWATEATATRILMRACGSFQAGILTAERGMTAEARIMARSLIEDAFCLAALAYKPDEFLAMLKEDSDASRRLQGKFIEAAGLIAKGEERDKLLAAIDQLGKPDTMNVKRLAGLGPLTKQYLYYQRLSDDAAHTSGKALEHHVAHGNGGWCFRWGPATGEETAATLHHLVIGGMPIAVGAVQILKDEANGKALAPLADRFSAMPNVKIV